MDVDENYAIAKDGVHTCSKLVEIIIPRSIELDTVFD